MDWRNPKTHPYHHPKRAFTSVITQPLVRPALTCIPVFKAAANAGRPRAVRRSGRSRHDVLLLLNQLDEEG